MNIIKDETNLQPDPNMTKLQEQARVSVTDATDRTPQYQPMTTDVKDSGSHKGASTNEALPVDPKLSPSQGLKRGPDTPASPSHKDLKINFEL